MSEAFIYLASASPRRRELLEQIGISHRLLSVDLDERQHVGEAPEMYVLRVALEKARAGWRMLEPQARRPVLGADTAVVIDGEVLGKPRDRAHGLAMLARLSGCSHQVLTGVAVVGEGGRELSRLNVSTVTFRELSAAEREAYWATGEPVDKAGAYAVQGRAAVFISRLEGSYSGVMGLPLYETAELLRDFRIPVLALD
ncbi:MAG: Maf family protein [Gammaproteobacteria bacterium]